MEKSRHPALFISHGAPPLADHETWPTELRNWANSIEKPKAILIVSAHWENNPIAIGATTTVPLVYDFYGFPERYYQVEYKSPGAPDLAERIKTLFGADHIEETSRGLDHGAYVPLVEMFPDADVPVLQISMPTLNPVELFKMGKKLAHLRDEGVLIIGSGFATHNLAMLDMGGGVASFMAEFDNWLAEALASHDIDQLIDFENDAPAPMLAHPRTEHFAPLFVALGATDGEYSKLATPIEGFWMGMSRRSVQFN